MKISAQPVRGTKDFLPKEVEIRDYVQRIIEKTYKQFGFIHITTPIMEDIERLNKSDGGENLSMIFKLLKRGQKLDLSKPDIREDDLVDSGLRYDLTMPLARYFANNKENLPLPFKSIQIDKVFRAERPQKGRLREFYQCDIDIIGNKTIEAEMELIAATSQALLNIGFDDFTIRINDRRLLSDMIKYAGFLEEDVSSVCIIFDKLDKIGLEGVKKELLEKEYSEEKVEKFIEIINKSDTDALKMAENFCSTPEIIEDLKKVLDFANKISCNRYKAVYDKSLVRGMGYYTGLVFEIVSPKFGSSVAGGGRYDKMVGKFLGEDIPAVGFSIGFERVTSILLEESFPLPEKNKVIVIYNQDDDYAKVMEKVKEYQEKGAYVTTLKSSKKLGKQIDMLIDNGYNISYNMANHVEKPLTK